MPRREVGLSAAQLHFMSLPMVWCLTCVSAPGNSTHQHPCHTVFFSAMVIFILKLLVRRGAAVMCHNLFCHWGWKLLVCSKATLQFVLEHNSQDTLSEQWDAGMREVLYCISYSGSSYRERRSVADPDVQAAALSPLLSPAFCLNSSCIPCWLIPPLSLSYMKTKNRRSTLKRWFLFPLFLLDQSSSITG